LVADATSGGSQPSYRPAGTKPFDPFVIASVRRMAIAGPLVVLGVNGRIEANLMPKGDAVVCNDLEGPALFSLKRYRPVEGGVVAFTADDEPMATYLPDGVDVAVRDGTSAPVATLRPQRGARNHYDLVETGGKRRLASVWRQEYELRDVIDDQWTVQPSDGHLPVTALALVALLVVCAARFPSVPRPVNQQRGVIPGALDLLR
jgi:hypothetical protein